MTNVFGLIVLALVIYAIVMIIQSRAGTAEKVLWALLVVLLPVLGLIIWALLGPGSPLKR
ncbi:PLDc N-terminal domain-containing protein [Isoalcanivorax indicus]|uniref:PLDc N-terminal domain-containing protein n=1 Tax=Isoalcanivorax indicus TaxID=2202653 RepID=UPI000DBA15ED|nr:PLDc N-terminal domain-containing protein [Isoalcanivorax indicus]